MDIYYLILYFFTYGFLGWCAEVAYAAVKEKRFVNRGFLNGPICPVYGVGVSAVLLLLEPFENNLVILYVASVIIVTLIEGLTGFALDKIFHHKWWDYSGQPFNIGGYVCPIFSLVWGVACIFIVKVFQPLVYRVAEALPHALGVALIVVLSIVTFADLYVTASGILKFNKRLEMMERIASELRDISDKMGSNIYENVMDTMEKQEEVGKKLDEVTDDIKGKLEEFGGEQKERAAQQKERAVQLREYYVQLKERYAQLAKSSTKVSERLVKAFPKMESRNHKDILEELKKGLEEKRKKGK
ncbi:hypothetical protein OCV99_10650 [Dorea acetigenes]|uniref:ABC-transporter type IV n=1 Tax=Dorea acetigenes TaxID=2981787 RepID=A0ABT2RNT3_9FIRM|nr:putative ABC transporter permease [Dorea acetigenes]MCU6687001.1 hypothetical protein [Dorea acetigenes]SCJ21709.1 Predicted membrane protein [uncultured Clostridium sp.]